MITTIPRTSHATAAITNAATPSSSLLTVIFVVTPDFDEYAIRMLATTRPPPTVFPSSLRVWVVWFTGTSVPSTGCKESVFASCSVASIKGISGILDLRGSMVKLTGNALHAAEEQSLVGLLSCSTNLLPQVVKVASESRDDVVASSEIKLRDFVLIIVTLLRKGAIAQTVFMLKRKSIRLASLVLS